MAILLLNKSRAGIMLRMGRNNRWAMEYWCSPLPDGRIVLAATRAAAWIVVLTVPMASTGLLSSTILKDVAIAILVAQIVSTRGVIVLLAVCTTLALLRRRWLRIRQ